MPLPTGVYRADHVGSLLRPKEILQARADLPPNSNDTSSLKAMEDKYISDVVRKELQVGIRSITDGEFRRAYFHLDFLQHLGGVKVEGSLASTNSSREGFTPPKLVITDKVRHIKPIQLNDFLYLEKEIAAAKKEGIVAENLRVTTKVAIPSPTMCHFRGSRDTISSTAYPELGPFFTDLAAAYQAEIRSLYDAGCRFLQLDDTNLAYLCDPSMRQSASDRHSQTPEQITKQYADLINAAISKRPSDMVIGIHLCRGNHRSQWFASGGYEPVAQVLFQQLNVDVYFLEYDDARSGDFAPLRFLPVHKVVVLGVMSSKSAKLDDKEMILQRLQEAAKYVPKGLDQLCVSHQCGFSSTMEGNELSEQQQWAKIRLEVEIAKEVWGQDLSK